jgi:hypothetical protein
MPKGAPSRRRRRGRRSTKSYEKVRPRGLRLRGNRWVTLPLIVGGLVLFSMGNIGARAGIQTLPFDPHHVFQQFGGAVLLITGLMLL